MKKLVLLVAVLIFVTALTSCDPQVRTDDTTDQILLDNLKEYLQQMKFSQNYTKINWNNSSTSKAYYKFDEKEQYSYESNQLELYYFDNTLYVHDISTNTKYKKVVSLSGETFISDYNTFVPKVIQWITNNASNITGYKYIGTGYGLMGDIDMNKIVSLGQLADASSAISFAAYFNQNRTVNGVRIHLKTDSTSTDYILLGSDNLANTTTIMIDAAGYKNNDKLDVTPYLFDLKM